MQQTSVGITATDLLSTSTRCWKKALFSGEVPSSKASLDNQQTSVRINATD
jgi:hypothetical protein